MKIVSVRGHIGISDAFYISKLLNNKFNTADEDPTFCLHFGSGEGSLGRWVDESGTINASGAIYEDRFDDDDIEAALTYLAHEFPSLMLTMYSEDIDFYGQMTVFEVRSGACSRGIFTQVYQSAS